MIQGIGHIGIFVRDLEASLEGLCNLLGIPRPPIKDNTDWRMKVALVEAGGLQLELVEDYSQETWVAESVRERGDHIHHFCLLSDDLEADLAALGRRGVRAKMPSPVKGLRGKRIIFLESETVGGVSVELSEP
ncbi:MAG: methylmalonyl-CoA epimerase [Desulfarculus sp.]|jgi:methylmalonyl-CoA/ethylmalonyl-CoA epimerase|nr:MAG: methylmalonyl-CoA epimerase [Desulfarculus sp.]